jgi:Flp pilus assembly CpaF family ATPase
LDNADAGNEEEKQLFRFINPMIKKWSAETGVYMVRESMELMGGLGYIEDTVMPKLMRDVMVLPIWEGSGNVIVLDMLRAMSKSTGFEILCKEIIRIAKTNTDQGNPIAIGWMEEKLTELISFSARLKDLQQDEMEATAKLFFEKLTSLFQVALLLDAMDEESKEWIVPALDFLISKYEQGGLHVVKPLAVKQVKDMMGWVI